MPHIFASYVSDDYGVSVSHHFEGHVHETHGHKTPISSGHGEENRHNERKAEKRGISFICSGGSIYRSYIQYITCGAVNMQ